MGLNTSMYLGELYRSKYCYASLPGIVRGVEYMVDSLKYVQPQHATRIYIHRRHHGHSAGT